MSESKGVAPVKGGVYIFDLEIYPNTFTCCIADVSTRKLVVYEISSRKDQRQDLIAALRVIARTKGEMVGFNNLQFDYPLLHWFLLNQEASVLEIYEKGIEIIKAENSWSNIVKDDETFIKQIDLFKIHHFDNMARMTSLKMLEFNMRSANIEDLPFPVGKVLTDHEIDVLIKYNKHDVKQTFAFYEHSKEQIGFRKVLTEKYGKNFMNHNDTKIGKDYFVMELEKNNKGCCYRNGKVRQTRRKSIKLKECIFDYVKFNRPEFQAVLEWFKNQEIKETKGVFTELLESDLMDIPKYATMRTKRKKLPSEPTEEEKVEWRRQYPMCWFEEVVLQSKKISYYVMWNIVDTLNVVVEGMQYDMGVGGLHSAKSKSIITSCDKRVIKSEDVKVA